MDKKKGIEYIQRYLESIETVKIGDLEYHSGSPGAFFSIRVCTFYVRRVSSLHAVFSCMFEQQTTLSVEIPIGCS